MGLITATLISSGATFNVDESNISKLYQKGSVSVIEYLDAETGYKVVSEASEAAADLFSQASRLFSTTLNGTTIYLNADRIVRTESVNGLARLSYRVDGDTVETLQLGVSEADLINSLPSDAPGGGAAAEYVSASSGDDGTGTRGDSSLPFATLGAARDAAIPGDLISVAAGAYNTNNANLGKNQVDWFFANGAEVVAETTAPIWNDVPQGYCVYGYGEFNNGLLQSPYLVYFNQSSSKISIQCRSIRGNCTLATVWVTNSGYGKYVEAYTDIQNTETGNFGRLLYFQGGGTGKVTVKSPLLQNTVQSLGFTGSTAEQGTVITCAGNSYDVDVFSETMTNPTVASLSAIYYGRTAATGKTYVEGDFIKSFSSYQFYYAAISHQGGEFEHKGNATVVNGSAYYASNLGAVNKFKHISGLYQSDVGNAIRLHDTLARTYQFDGEYESGATQTYTLGISGNITGSRVDMGLARPFGINNLATTNGVGIRNTTAYVLHIHNGFIFVNDTAGGEAIDTNAADNVFVKGSLSANVDKNASVTILPAAKFAFDNAITY